MMRWRMSGRRIFGSGRLTSSKAIVSFIPGKSSSGSGSWSSGMQQRVQDRTVDVAQRLDRLGRVDDAAAVGGELLEAEVLTAPEEDGRGGAIHLEDEAGTGHYRWFSCLRSNATFTAPRRPAAEAWAMASS